MTLACALAFQMPTPSVPTEAIAKAEIPKANKEIVKKIEHLNSVANYHMNEYLKYEIQKKKEAEKAKKAEKIRKAKEKKLREQKRREEARKKREQENSKVNLGQFKITHYCSCGTCNPGNANRTASGKPMVVGRTVAVDTSVIPLHSKLLINGQIYYAEDTGVIGNKIDVLVNSHDEAYDKGVYYTNVYLLK